MSTLSVINQDVCVPYDNVDDTIVKFYRSVQEFIVEDDVFERRIDIWFADNDLHTFKAWGE